MFGDKYRNQDTDRQKSIERERERLNQINLWPREVRINKREREIRVDSANMATQLIPVFSLPTLLLLFWL